MYCSKCGKENPDNAQLCQSCSSVLTNTPKQAPVLGVKTSGMAIAAFVLGILSFFTLGITAIPAIILGIVGLMKIGKSTSQLKGKGFAIAGIVIPTVSVFFLLLILTLVITKAQTKIAQARVLNTKANLKSLHYAVNQFKMDTGRFPAEDEGLKALIEKPNDVDVKYWEPGGYLETMEVPKDSWGNDFIYELYPESGKQFQIRSMGSDSEEGTEDDLLSTDMY